MKPVTDTQKPFLRTAELTKTFRKRGLFGKSRMEDKTAVKNVNLELFTGDILGLIGESGCGKSTLARLILGLLHPTSGSIYINGININEADKSQMKTIRKESRLIFQSLDAALNPFMRAEAIIEEPIKLYTNLSRDERKERIREIIKDVNLMESLLSEFPGSMSGGQKRRLSVARAIAVPPKFIVADEPVSALDVSIRAQILELLRDLHSKYGLTMIFISHDISVLSEICNKIAVMNKGEIVESGQLGYFTSKNYTHSYTQKLMSSVLEINNV